MDCLLNKKDGIKDFPVGHEASLVLGNERMKMGFKVQRKNFGQNFIRGITKRNGPKSGEG